MKNFTKLFKYEETYQENLKQYTLQDGVLAFAVFGIFIIMYTIMGVLEVKLTFIQENIMLIGCICNGVLIIVTILIVKARKQSLSSIGLVKGKWKTSCITGMILAAIWFFNNCGSYLLQGNKLISGQKIIVYIIYFLLVSICEEVAFRGFISTRLNGVIKSRWLVVLVSGLLFIIMHFPYRMIAYGMSLHKLTIGNPGWILDLFVTHLILHFIYAKTNSLYGAILPHWMSNLANSIVDR